jgi:hypothetical protein
MAEAAGPAETEADACLAETQVIEQLLCLADIAKRAADPEPCLRAAHEGVRWQCVAILAEHLKDAGLCRTIPRTDEEYQGLYDICLSDIAEVRQDPALCTEIETQGLRDSCYLKVVQRGASSELCARIVDPGLKSACTGEPVYLE